MSFVLVWKRKRDQLLTGISTETGMGEVVIVFFLVIVQAVFFNPNCVFFFLSLICFCLEISFRSWLNSRKAFTFLTPQYFSVISVCLLSCCALFLLSLEGGECRETERFIESFRWLAVNLRRVEWRTRMNLKENDEACGHKVAEKEWLLHWKGVHAHPPNSNMFLL